MKKFLLALCLLMGYATLHADTATVNGITWTYQVSNGEAQIYGRYADDNYIPAIPSSTRGAITIPATLGGYPVTSIGERAFYNCSSLTLVTIPSSVTSIEYEAFSGCSNLWKDTNGVQYESAAKIVLIDVPTSMAGEFAIPNSVRFIHSYAFENCSNLTSVTIPEGVTSIGDYAFYYCYGLTSVTIPSSVTSIGDRAFANCSNLKITMDSANTVYASLDGALFNKSMTELIRGPGATSNYTIPSSVTSIGDYAFYYCYGLTSVTIPSSVTSIGDSAFYNCWSLTSVTIPSSVTSIGYEAFALCSSLTSVTIPSSVTSIGEDAFKGCSSLTSVTIPSSVTSIGEDAFKGCSSLTSVTIPEGVTSIGNYAFRDCSSLTSVTISSSVTSIGDYAFYRCSSLTSVTIPEGVTTIGNSAFYDCSSLTSVTISSSVTSIGDYAFYNCSSLTSVTIPSSVTSIGNCAFRGCSNLTSVTIPSSVTSIGSAAFSGCSGLTSVTIPSSVTSIGNSAFYGCSGLTSVTIPEGVTSIGAFAYCSSLTSVTIPSSVTSIENFAFYGCSSLTSVTIPSSVTSIGDYAFQKCSGLTSVTIPESVTSIGDRAFEDCSSLTSVTIPSSVTSIGLYAFQNCSSLTSVTISEGVTFIGYEAFSGCSRLTSVTIPSSVTSIGDGAFSGCSNLWKDTNGVQYESEARVFLIDVPTSMTGEFAIPNSVRFIHSSAFYDCSSLTSVTIPSSVTSIRDEAFYSCSGLTSVTIPASVTSIGDDAFNGVAPMTLTAAWLPSGTSGMLKDNLKTVIIPEGVTSIKSSAFSGCSNLTSVTIPSSVTSIGDRAFSGCSSLTSVTIPEGVTSIGNSAFAWCSGLTSVTIPEGVTSIGRYAFEDCSNLTSVTIPSSVTSIGNYAFSSCSGLTSVTIPEGVTTIGSNAFYGVAPETLTAAWLPSGMSKNNLTTLIIPEGVTTIGDSAFYGCKSLTSVTIPSSVTSIGDDAFRGCSSLTSVDFKGEPPQNVELLIADLPKSVKFIYTPIYFMQWQEIIQGLEDEALCSNFVMAEMEGVVFHDEEIVATTSWEVEKEHWILRDVVVKANGGALTIAPGTVVKFLPGTRLIVEEGATVVATNVTFTHIYDRDVGLNLGSLSETCHPQCYDYQIEGELVTNEETLFRYYDFNQPFYLGVLREDTTFEEGKVYIVSNRLTLPSGVTLTIEPGAIVKFMPKASLVVNNGGVCIAQGAIFTHINDDAIGGDTLKDGGATHPVMGEYTVSGNVTDDETTEYYYLMPQELTSDVTRDTSLRGHCVYVVSSPITVSNNATLTIQPGAILKFKSEGRITVNNGAILNAIGTRAAPIIFTSIKDDAIGGDTNGDGNKILPQPGDWMGIWVYGSASFNYSHIYYNSSKENYGGLEAHGGRITFDNSEIAHTRYECVNAHSGGAFVANNSIFRDASLAFGYYGSGKVKAYNCVFSDLTVAIRQGGKELINCVFYKCFESFTDQGGDGSTFKNCLFYNPPAYGPQTYNKVGQNGNIWGDPLFVDPMNGDFRIVEGSPCVDAADSTVAPKEDYYGQPRITMTEQEEGAELVGQLADIGICEVMPRDITSDIDLVPLSVRTASEAKPGELLFVEWDVQNVGGAAVEHQWRDTILLVSENGYTVTLGEKVAGNQIVAGGTVFCSGYFTVPAIAEGSWYVKVNVNSYRDIFEGSLIQNNALTGDRPITLSLEALDANTTTEGVVDANSSKVLKFTYDEGDTNRMMTVKVPAGVKVTWGFGFVPQGVANSGTTVAGTEGATFRVPENATDVYVVIESETTAEYEVSTESTKIVVTSVYPTTLPSSGTTTLTITGAGFDDVKSIVLVNAGKNCSIESFVMNPDGALVATVDCSTLQAGAVYTLTVSDENNAASLTNAITVTKAEGKGHFWTKLLLPDVVREGREYTCYIEYGNDGNADMPCQIVQVNVRDGGSLRYVDNAMSFDKLHFIATTQTGNIPAGNSKRIPFVLFTGRKTTVDLFVETPNDVEAISRGITRVAAIHGDVTNYRLVMNQLSEDTATNIDEYNAYSKIFTHVTSPACMCVDVLGNDDEVMTIRAKNLETSIEYSPIRVKNSSVEFTNLPNGIYLVTAESSTYVGNTCVWVGKKPESVSLQVSRKIEVTGVVQDVSEDDIVVFIGDVNSYYALPNPEGRYTISLPQGVYNAMVMTASEKMYVMYDDVEVANGVEVNFTCNTGVVNYASMTTGMDYDDKWFETKYQQALKRIENAENLFRQCMAAYQPPQGEYYCPCNNEIYLENYRTLELFRITIFTFRTNALMASPSKAIASVSKSVSDTARAYLDYWVGSKAKYATHCYGKWAGGLFNAKMNLIAYVTEKGIDLASIGITKNFDESIDSTEKKVNQLMNLVKEPELSYAYVKSVLDLLSELKAGLIPLKDEFKVLKNLRELDTKVINEMEFGIIGTVDTIITTTGTVCELISSWLTAGEDFGAWIFARLNIDNWIREFEQEIEKFENKLPLKSYMKHCCRVNDDEDITGPLPNLTDSIDSNQSCDPNEMAGPLGIGDPETERFIKPGDWLNYTVYFENKSEATAAAQEVRVTNPLSQYLDWSTFEMGEVSFNNQIDLGLDGKQTGASEVALNNTAYKVKTTVALDQTKGEVNWYLRIVDPSTETTWPEDVYAGILPPNDETHRGEGHLTYRVKVRDDAPAGMKITNSASIVFDYNEPIETDPAWWNTVAPHFTQTFNANGGEGSTSVTLEYGADLTAAQVTREGYTLTGWLPEVPTIVPAQNVTYVAQWQVNQFTSTFKLYDGAKDVVLIQDYATALTAPTVTRTGYTFTGWSPAVPATVPAQNVTYTAQWKVNPYTMTFNANGGVGGKTVKQAAGTTLTAPTVTREGYTFTGWSPAVPKTVPAKNMTYTAQWKVNQYALTFKLYDGAQDIVKTQDYGSALTAPVVTREGYTFTGWSPAVPATTPATNATYTAQWNEVKQYTTTVNGIKWTYQVSNGKASITDCPSSISGSITIPSTLSGYPVTSIGVWAFNGCSRLTSVTIPEGVASIGYRAFAWCSSLVSVTIPSSVTSIGYDAFLYCESLTSVMIPDGVTSIENGAFFGCSRLTSVTIPASVTSIGDSAFYECSRLTSVTISEGVTIIGDSAFRFCSRLTSVTIPSSVTTIGSSAFSGCKRLTSVAFKGMPPSVGRIAFYGVSSSATGSYLPQYASEWEAVIDANGKWDELTMVQKVGGDNPRPEEPLDVTYKRSGKKVIVTGKKSDFKGEALTIPAMIEGCPVTEIAKGAFKGDTVLTAVTISEGVTTIGADAFKGCTALDPAQVTLPSTLKKVGKGAFTGCKVTEVSAVPGEPLTSKQLGKAVGYKVATSASGLKLNAKTGDITATFKKSGTYEAVLFKPGANLKVVRIKVGDMPKLTIKMEGANTGCSVKGAGSYLMGKKVSLSAKASKEKIFIGFYDEKGNELTKNMKYSFVMGRENRTLTAKFKEEIITINTSALTSKTWKVGETVNVTIPVTAESGVKSVKAKLPTGLKLAKTKDGKWQVTGSPKKVGAYTVTFTVGTVQKKQKVANITMKVVAESVTINTAAVKNKNLNVGEAASGLTIGATATSGIKSVKASKLPSGMKVQQINGVWQLTGAPKKAGTYTVTLTITTKANTKVIETFTLTVALLPDWAVKTFSGEVVNVWEGYETWGTAQVTIFSTGNVRGDVSLNDGAFASLSGTAKLLESSNSKVRLQIVVPWFDPYGKADGKVKTDLVIQKTGQGVTLSYLDVAKDSSVTGTLR